MALLAILDSLDGLADPIKAEYVEKDGKFHLNVTAVGGVALEDVTGLKTALGKERNAAQQAATKLKQFEGLDPAVARDAIAKVAEFAAMDIPKQIEERVKAREQDLIAKHTQAVNAVQDTLKKTTSQLQDNLVTSVASKAIADAKGSVGLLLPHVTKHTRMRLTDAGTYIAEVVDSVGNPRVGDAQGNPMTIPQLVEEMRGNTEYSRAFESAGATGSGASGGGRTGGTQTGKAVKTVDKTDQRGINQNLEAIAKGEVTVTGV